MSYFRFAVLLCFTVFHFFGESLLTPHIQMVHDVQVLVKTESWLWIVSPPRPNSDGFKSCASAPAPKPKLTFTAAPRPNCNSKV
jgi:hypothetical protein